MFLKGLELKIAVRAPAAAVEGDDRRALASAGSPTIHRLAFAHRGSTMAGARSPTLSIVREISPGRVRCVNMPLHDGSAFSRHALDIQPARNSSSCSVNVHADVKSSSVGRAGVRQSDIRVVAGRQVAAGLFIHVALEREVLAIGTGGSSRRASDSMPANQRATLKRQNSLVGASRPLANTKLDRSTSLNAAERPQWFKAVDPRCSLRPFRTCPIQHLVPTRAARLERR